MEQIQVGRWLFWAGVLVLVASIALSAFYGQESNPPYGVSWNVMPLFVTVALILLLASAVFGRPLDPDARDGRTDPSAGTR